MTTPVGTNTPRRRILWIVIGAVVLVVVAGAIIFLGTRHSSSTSADPTNSFSPTPGFTPSTPTPLPTATAPAQSSKPVAFSSPAPVMSGVVVTVTKIESVQGTATQSGEVAGPSVRFTVKFTNSTSSSVSLATAVVNAYYTSALRPAIELSHPGAVPFPDSVPAGGSATGIFVFNIPKADRSEVELTVDYSVNTPTIVFRGVVK